MYFKPLFWWFLAKIKDFFKIKSIILFVVHRYLLRMLDLIFLNGHFVGMLRRKTLVLDLDETLIHSHHDGVIRQTVKPGTPPDFVLKVRFTKVFLQVILL